MIEDIVDRLMGMDPQDLRDKVADINPATPGYAHTFILWVYLRLMINNNYFGEHLYEIGLRQAVRNFVMFGGVRID